MSSAFWKSVLISPVVLGISLLLSTGVIAAPKTATGNASDLILNKASGATPVSIAATEPAESPDEVVSEIVKPTDSSYQALQGIATKYGCEPNLNNKPVSQIEFARGLNVCLSKVEPMLAQQPASVTREDLEVIQRLTQEYRAQLAEIDSRLVNTDKKVAQLQANQFSTTTKLKGEAVFNVASVISGGDNSNIIFADRVRLLFQSSFTGKDILWTRLATGNQPSLGGTFRSPSTVGGQVIETGGTNSVSVDWLAYQFPVANTNVYVAAFNALQADYAPTYGSNFDDFSGASGAISAFAESSPIYKIGGGSGVGTNIPIAETGLTSVSLGYFAFGANNPTNTPPVTGGLFGTDNSLFGQLNFKLSPQLEGGLTYINSSHNGSIFNGTGVVVGTPLANNLALTSPGGRTTADSFGLALAYKASDKLAFNGFAMTTNARRGGVTDNIWSYGAGISFPDVDGRGSLAGIFVGAEPYVGGVGSTPFHFEGFYKYKLSDNLSITPGLIYLTSPDQVTNNSALIGVVRTTFLF
ncbi:iron uptake porin [Chamaesiphon minutus]|uniref:Carbohydrate-selective porin, OprB family n=1 Tax=Chamaesiphon minutus (strain ATCC 27169 / PCC 6605) TaxID=1173020 RepID=K9UCY3_CHAP6|nr:iron uptake porin [Chamaesiphon minutus]AFY92074.1 Carbohydrate-selective porin, OprB family [Chamaesiphon minutus PCC 6605]